MSQLSGPVPAQYIISSPKIRVQSAPPDSVDGGSARLIPCQARKRSATVAHTDAAAPEQDCSIAAARMSRHGAESSAKKRCLSPSAKKSKSCAKDVDWADVTEPEERRRIQNRIAQRKFREKARENRERAERESRNQEHAGNSYRIPVAADIVTTDHELSGLPWGGMSLGLVVSRGHEAESLRSSGRDTYVGDEPYASPHYAVSLAPGLPQTASYGSSGGEDVFYDDANYAYDYEVAAVQAFTPPL